MKRTIIFTILIALIIGCVPPETIPNDSSGIDAKEQAKQDSVRLTRCEMFLSFGAEYYKQQGYEKAKKNFLKVINLECGDDFYEKYVESLYYRLGSCYQNLSELDSALYYFNAGLSHSPENIALIENLAYTYGRKNDVGNQLKMYKKLSNLKPKDIDNLWKIIDILKKNNEFEQVINHLNKIIEISPENQRAQIELETAYLETGRDPIAIVKSQWEFDRANVYNGLKYAQMIYDRDDKDGALSVYEELFTYDAGNVQTLEKLSTLYNDFENYLKALEMLKALNKLQPEKIKVIEDIVLIYNRLHTFEKAIFWANKAINMDPKNGNGFEIRGKVYEESANYCSSLHDGDKNFQDKLVYQIAYDNYKKAKSLGNARVISKLDYVANFIPTEEDFFMVEEKPEYKPSGECYQWINLTVKHP
ncbi:MAG: hypothetical protein ISS00_02565 [Candidatus Marinimicrobia bacterium]|nr:hypothetical protein [Candidatus Neomarinimicrobiota bacterium]